MRFNGPIIRLAEVGSTNNYTSELLRQSDTPDWTVVVAGFQRTGRGQREKSWYSNPGENLLCSILRRLSMPVEQQFHVSAAAAVGVCELLGSKGLQASIKWPNDIFIGSCKVAGLLIENQVVKERLEHSIIGIGLNVNQQHFPGFPWPATSMRLHTGRVFDLDQLLDELIAALDRAMCRPAAEVVEDYRWRMFGRGVGCRVETGGQTYEGVLKGVSPDGRLELEIDGVPVRWSNASIRAIGNDVEGFSPRR